MKKDCKDAVETMYVIKNTLYMLRSTIIEEGIVVDNEDKLDDEIIGMIDKDINEGQ